MIKFVDILQAANLVFYSSQICFINKKENKNSYVKTGFSVFISKTYYVPDQTAQKISENPGHLHCFNGDFTKPQTHHFLYSNATYTKRVG